MLSLGSSLISTGTYLALIVMIERFEPSPRDRRKSDGCFCNTVSWIALMRSAHHTLVQEVPRIAFELCYDVLVTSVVTCIDS